VIDEPLDSFLQDAPGQAFVRVDARSARDGILDPRPGTHHDGGANPLGMARREGETHAGSHRVADQVDAGLPKGVQHEAQVLEAAPHPVFGRRGGCIGVAVTDEIDEDATAILSQPFGYAAHRLHGSGEAVEDQDRLALACLRIRHLHV
jgi:hypothetical protein